MACYIYMQCNGEGEVILTYTILNRKRIRRPGSARAIIFNHSSEQARMEGPPLIMHSMCSLIGGESRYPQGSAGGARSCPLMRLCAILEKHMVSSMELAQSFCTSEAAGPLANNWPIKLTCLSRSRRPSHSRDPRKAPVVACPPSWH